MSEKSAITLNARGMIIIDDPELLELISGGGDTCDGSSNTICGVNVVCVPVNVVCGGDSGGGGVNRPKYPPQK